MAEITFRDVGKVYPDGTRAVRGMDLDIVDGEFMVFVGPSGCGKTTALRMVAGLEEISEGTIAIGDRIVNDVPAKDRDIAMVFQSYALYPHMSVAANMGFGLVLRKVPKDEIRARVERAAKLLGLDELLERKPRALSGGQRQRVAMGRAIVREPKAFLMDEPLSNLDAKLRVQMRAEISELQRQLGVTTIYVTHDQVEAMTMGDRVAVIRKGELQQVAPPQTLYDHPVNVFVAGFIGSPAMNMVMASVRSEGDDLWLSFGDQKIALHHELATLRKPLSRFEGKDVILGIRPEDLQDAAVVSEDRPRLKATLKLREPLGAEIVAHVTLRARPAVTDQVRELAEDVGDAKAVESLDRPSEEVTFVCRFSPRSEAKEGDVVDMAVDTRMIHVFDPTTGLSIREGESA